MTTMTQAVESRYAEGSLSRVTWLTVLVVAVVLGAYLRFEGLGVRSLWRDELCTWHVSRMDLNESLRWGPELTKPPLYQLVLRVLTRDPHPSEAMLRAPAAACGVLTILVGWWLGTLGGGRLVGAAMALLCATNGLQIYYSQEARPYSMFLLGCAVSTGLWYRVVTDGRWRYVVAYVLAAALTLHAHYLAMLTLGGHVLWWIIVAWLDPAGGRRRRLRPLGALVATGVLCVPVLLRYLCFRSSMYQGLSWIAPPTWESTIEVLGRLTFGWPWIFVILVPATIVWAAGAFGVFPPPAPPSGGSSPFLPSHSSRPLRPTFRSGGPLFAGPSDWCGLLLAVFLAGWFALLVISWLTHPAMVARYALPAGVPATLIPLIVAHRWDRRTPVILAIVFTLATAPEWVSRGYASLHPPESRDDPGLRHLAKYLQDNADPAGDVVVLTLDATIYPGWEESERLIFDYYPIEGIPIAELRLADDNVTAQNDILKDPRGLYLVVLWADEMRIVRAAGRQTLPFIIEGRSFDRLLFTPYRLVHVAPLTNRARGDG